MGTLPAAPVPMQPERDHGDQRERRREEQKLFVEYARSQDAAILEDLVRRFLPLARRLAQRYRHLDEPIEDLTQVASIALIKAIKRFDPDRGTAFSSYAVPSILGELKRHFRDHGWDIHVPRGMQELVLRVEAAIGRLQGQLGRSPSPGEIADLLGVSTEEVLEAHQASAAYSTRSLDAPLAGEEGDRESFGDTIGEEDGAFELVEHLQAISEPLKQLAERERKILKLRFVNDLSQQAIADRIGISQMHVSRLLRRALAELREAAGAADGAIERAA